MDRLIRFFFSLAHPFVHSFPNTLNIHFYNNNNNFSSVILHIFTECLQRSKLFRISRSLVQGKLMHFYLLAPKTNKQNNMQIDNIESKASKIESYLSDY